MQDIFSHPGVPLIQHLSTVAANCKKTIAEKRLDFSTITNRPTTESGGTLGVIAEIAYIIGATHDFGKATSYFQHYLLSEDHEVVGPKNHALISSLLTHQIAMAYLDKLDKMDGFLKNLIPFFAYTAVKRHHGNLNNFKDELYFDKNDILQEQIGVIDEDYAQHTLNELLNPINVTFQWNVFRKFILSKTYERDFPDYYTEVFELGEYNGIPATQKASFHYLHQVLYATLLLSDKEDVIVKDEIPKAAEFNFNAIAAYRHRRNFDQPTSQIDQLKNEAYNDAIGFVQSQFQKKDHFYSITLPTGLGKTITSLAVAIEMKRRLDFHTKVIISIPFTSIIDQNYTIYNEIFDFPDSRLLLKHHHRSEPAYKINDDQLEYNPSQFLIETWQSEVVVTTFVQLLESILSNNKSKLMKLPNIANSVIILDEIQQIPYQYWELIREAFKALAERFNCYFILISATQPLIFEPGKEIQEIIPDHKKYFKFFNRTRLINRLHEEISFEDFTGKVVQYALQNPDKDILVILNTKKSTLELFKKAIDEISEEQADIFYLTTLITPVERKRIIDFIKTASSGSLKKKQRVIISTQLIEAGVDISVDTVFRAMAPMDAIIQAAGRANRYSEKNSVSEIYLYHISEMRTATSMIYGADLIIKTSNILKNIDTIDEKDYLNLIQAYFKEVRIQSDDYASRELQDLCNLNFKRLGEFSLINEQKTESVFVQLNEEAKRLWKEYETIYEEGNLKPYERKGKFSRIKSKFYDYVVNVPIPRKKTSIEFDREKTLNFYLSELDNPSAYYQYEEGNFRKNTGYAIEKTTISL